MTAPRRWRVALASAASAAMLVAAPLAGAQTATAQPYPPVPPLTVSPTTVTAGSPLTFSTIPGVFTGGADVTALLESTPVVLGHFRAARNGSVSGTVTIPRKTVPGWHVFRLTADHPDPSVGVSIYVRRAAPSPTPTPSHRPPHHHPGKPEHPGGPEHHPGGPEHGGHKGDSVPAAPMSYEDQGTHQDSDRGGKSLAATGHDKALVLGGTAAVLLLAGGGTVLAVRRRRSS